MELYKEILIKALESEKITVSFSESKLDLNRIIESKSYDTLCKIGKIIKGPDLEDSECFQKIEQIICEFEKIGSSGGTRHNF